MIGLKIIRTLNDLVRQFLLFLEGQILRNRDNFNDIEGKPSDKVVNLG